MQLVLFVANYVPLTLAEMEPSVGPVRAAEILGSEHFLVHAGQLRQGTPDWFSTRCLRSLLDSAAGQASLHADYHLIHLMNGPRHYEAFAKYDSILPDSTQNYRQNIEIEILPLFDSLALFCFRIEIVGDPPGHKD